MTIMYVLLVTIVSVISSFPALEASCPSQCDCYDTDVSCFNQDLSAVPPHIPPNTTSLFLDNNQIKAIKPGDITYLQNLTHLSANRNDLTVDGFDEFSLQGLGLLTMLSLDSNKFTSQPTGFPDSLKHLSLAYNQISGNVYFDSTPKLQFLDLSKNDLSYLSFLALNNNLELVSLDLSSNVLSSINTHSFMTLGDLEVLLLGGNMLNDDAVNAIDFQYASKLKNLSLANNPISEVPQNLPKSIINLQIGKTAIKVLPKGAFEPYQKLTWLDINLSDGLTIEPGAFVGLHQLGVLNINMGRLLPGVVSPGLLTGLPNLISLGINNNSIAAIEVGAFEDNPKLTMVWALRNLISTLDEDVFRDTAVRQVALTGNPIWCDCHVRWFKTKHVPLVIGRESLVCVGPDRVKGVMLQQLEPSDFVCP